MYIISALSKNSRHVEKVIDQVLFNFQVFLGGFITDKAEVCVFDVVGGVAQKTLIDSPEKTCC